MRKSIAIILMLAMVLSLSACAKKPQEVAKNDNVKIVLSKNAATVDGTAVEEFDYTWHADPSKGEYYTGTEPDTDASVYIAHDIIYYPKLDVDGFKLVNYDGEQEYQNRTAQPGGQQQPGEPPEGQPGGQQPGGQQPQPGEEPPEKR